MMRDLLFLGMLGAAIALAGCTVDTDESTDGDVDDRSSGGGNCPDARTGAGTTGQLGGDGTGGGDCPNAAATDDDPNVHADQSTTTETTTTTDTTTSGAYG